ncbi:M67 family metallopeptidase [Deferribacter autotrophicus]|uniref:M67 family metallopeptidase n=1 Tax=Deferribacter autotrophicus TaxID=500465 RepID=A0A5A8F2Q1_9BACT|nr:M67 family metallopeptidase [Deferribacter autotrophicus]KAA0257165.1 M67 family metallopeptidase [Deferribacter autotrophicus]
MLKIKKEIVEELFEYAISGLPNEVCGYLAGKGDVITNYYKIKNEDQSPEHFTFNVQEQFNAFKDARNRGLDIIAVYHSHPSTPARPSEEDIRLAHDPNVYYFIISLMNGQRDLKCFEIKDGKVKKIEYEVI